MILTGIGDEAGNTIDAQIAALQELGWKHLEARGVEVPGFKKGNFHEIPDEAFDIAAGKLSDAGIEILCFGTTILNWAKDVSTPWEITVGEVDRCIPRLQKVGCKFARIMSLKPADDAEQIPQLVIDRVKEVSNRFLDAGITPVHENCMNHGGMSPRHGLELLEKVPGLKHVFDTANPVFNADRSKPKPWPKQDPWEYWQAVKDHVVHIHIKDATWSDAKGDADYNWPGEGTGKVREILKDAFARGYDAGISIEPHMVVVFHDANSVSNDDVMRANFVEYGRRLEELIKEVKAD
jgi:sugar phosphate isomerase/epimerase